MSESPWQMVGQDGVRRTAGFPARDDYLRSGSVIVPGGFVVGSLTFEAPAGPLELYYVQPQVGKLVIWTIR